jgi:hypothetical protein
MPIFIGSQIFDVRKPPNTARVPAAGTPNNWQYSTPGNAGLPSWATFKCASLHRNTTVFTDVTDLYNNANTRFIGVDQAYCNDIGLMYEPGKITFSFPGENWKGQAPGQYNGKGDNFSQNGVIVDTGGFVWEQYSYDGYWLSDEPKYANTEIRSSQGYWMNTNESSGFPRAYFKKTTGSFINNLSKKYTLSYFGAQSQVNYSSMIASPNITNINYNIPGADTSSFLGIPPWNGLSGVGNNGNSKFKQRSVTFTPAYFDQYLVAFPYNTGLGGAAGGYFAMIQVEELPYATSYYDVNPDGSYRQPASLLLSLPSSSIFNYRIDFIVAVDNTTINTFNVIQDLALDGYVGLSGGKIASHFNGQTLLGATNITYAAGDNLSFLLKIRGNAKTVECIISKNGTQIADEILTHSAAFSFGAGLQVGSQSTNYFIPTNGIKYLGWG